MQERGAEGNKQTEEGCNKAVKQKRHLAEEDIAEQNSTGSNSASDNNNMEVREGVGGG